MLVRLIQVACIGLFVQACAGGQEPDRKISVVTTPDGATCDAERGGVRLASIGPTPAVLGVSASSRSITLTCRRHDAQPTVQQIDTVARPEMVAAYGLAAGVSGLLIGSMSGAFHAYPDTVSITLIPASFATAAQRDRFFADRHAELLAVYTGRLATMNGGCPAGDTGPCRAQIQAEEMRRDAELARVEAMRQATPVGS